MVKTDYKHITIHETKGPVIAGTRMRVTHLVLDKQAYGWTPEQMVLQYPFLNLAQIHSAFAYYWDHKQELDDQIQRDFEYVEKMRLAAGPSPIAEKIRQLGLR